MRLVVDAGDARDIGVIDLDDLGLLVNLTSRRKDGFLSGVSYTQPPPFEAPLSLFGVEAIEMTSSTSNSTVLAVLAGLPRSALAGEDCGPDDIREDVLMARKVLTYTHSNLL